MSSSKEAAKLFAAQFATLISANSVEKSSEEVILWHGSVFNYLFGVVNMCEVDFFEFIERDETRELLAVPINKSFWFGCLCRH